MRLLFHLLKKDDDRYQGKQCTGSARRKPGRPRKLEFPVNDILIRQTLCNVKTKDKALKVLAMACEEAHQVTANRLEWRRSVSSTRSEL